MDVWFETLPPDYSIDRRRAEAILAAEREREEDATDDSAEATDDSAAAVRRDAADRAEKRLLCSRAALGGDVGGGGVAGSSGEGVEVAITRRERCLRSCAAYGKVCPHACQIAADAACEALQKLKAGSDLFPRGDDEIPNFTYLNSDDLVIGEKLGEGGFCTVNRCVVTTGDEAGQEFAVKYLKRKAMVDLHHFKHGAADLAVEAYFLQTLRHENIVTLHGFTAGSVATNVQSGKECGLFIVIDRICDTLEQRIEEWARAREKRDSNLLTRWTTEHKERRKKDLMERIRTAHMIANALEYLHGRNIVFRDLKPDNCGFDKDGVLKLFDFGLATELKPGALKEDGKYELTGNTGSRRYMAPEVAKEESYGKPVDVYSFGILLWELCSAEKPFTGYSSGKHMRQVVMGGQRPSMDQNHAQNWPLNLKWLIQRCWADSPSTRPTFAVVKQVLADILASKETIPDSVVGDNNDPETTTTAATEDEPLEEHYFIGGLSSIFRSPLATNKTAPRHPTRRRAKSWGFGLRR